MAGNLTPEPAGTVSPMHYQHCRQDVRLTGMANDALRVVAAAEQRGVSVRKALADADIDYVDKVLIAGVWKKNGRGPAADREEFYQ